MRSLPEANPSMLHACVSKTTGLGRLQYARTVETRMQFA
jgi:hypothetical protein